MRSTGSDMLATHLESHSSKTNKLLVFLFVILKPLKSAKVAFIHISTRPDLPFEIAQNTIETINECLDDKIDDVYIGTNTSQEQTSDIITCGIMLGGIEQRK